MPNPMSGLQSFEICMIIFPIIAVTLRFWSRALHSGPNTRPLGSQVTRFWWDDWFALLSLPLSVIGNGLAIYVMPSSFESSIPRVAPEQLMKASFAAFLIWDVAITLPKISVLFFYDRVFGSTQPAFRYALWLGHGLNVAWLLAHWFVTIFSCDPPARWWDESLPGTCMSPLSPWLAAVIPQTILDLYVLVLPLPMLLRLQLKPSRKFLVSGVFVCGYSVVVVSFTRLMITVTDPTSLSETMGPSMSSNAVACIYLLYFQVPISLVSICLPNIFQLVRRGINYGPKYLFTTQQPCDRSRFSVTADRETVLGRRATKAHLMDPHEQLFARAFVQSAYYATAEESSSRGSLQRSEGEPNGIFVTSEVHVSEEPKEDKSIQEKSIHGSTKEAESIV